MAVVADQKRETVLQSLADTVRAVDPHVRDAVLIGSAVYAPDLARDYDLVVTTASQEHLEAILFDTLNEVSDRPVDLIFRHPGEDMGDLAKAVLAGLVLLGNGETIQEAEMFLGEGSEMVNSFKEAEGSIAAAEMNLRAAEVTIDPGTKDRLYKIAFDELFHAARNAAQAFLGRKGTRWGGTARDLPAPLDQQFREMITILHVKFFYDGKYPADTEAAARQFDQLNKRVESFIGELQQRTLDRDNEPER